MDLLSWCAVMARGEAATTCVLSGGEKTLLLGVTMTSERRAARIIYGR